jgi:hypothetical protein
MSTKAAAVIFVAVLTSLSALSACGGGESAQVNTGAKHTTADAERNSDEPASAQERSTAARADDAVARAEKGEPRTNKREKAAGRDAEGGNRSQGITIEIGGDPGTNFSGRCSVGGEEKVIGGRVPARYVYEPHGGKLECEIRKRGTGTLEVVLAAGNNVRSIQ